MAACLRIPRWPCNGPFVSWNSPWPKRKGNRRMSHRVGLDQASVVEAAVKLVDAEGIEQLTLGRLAERLGVRTPSLYNHVAGLPGLKHELMLYCLHDLLDRILRSIVHGFISLEVAGGFGMPVDLDASFHWLIKLFITGLSPIRANVKYDDD